MLETALCRGVGAGAEDGAEAVAGAGAEGGAEAVAGAEGGVEAGAGATVRGSAARREPAPHRAAPR